MGSANWQGKRRAPPRLEVAFWDAVLSFSGAFGSSGSFGRRSEG
jgi:hypothetical protein